jgi:hypothetical protein
MIEFVFTVVACLSAEPDKCLSQQLFIDEAPSTFCETQAFPAVAAWMAQALPGWTLARIADCGPGRPT